jgi:dihydrofolate reductase
MKIIACISQDWKLVPAAETPIDDKQRFAALTAGGHCWVGRKTYDELPAAMKAGSGGRMYNVLSRSTPSWRTVPELKDGHWCIGGLEIYRLAMPNATMLYLSVLRQPGGMGDFPDLKRPEVQWEQLCAQQHATHVFTILRRVIR